MDENKILKFIYTFFLGLLLAVFVGVGINTFYEAPEPPEYTPELRAYDVSGDTNDPERIEKVETYEQQQDAYRDKADVYNRNVSIISLVAAVTLVVVSLVYEKRIRIISDGVMLGGLFTLIYSIGRGFAADDSKYLFVVISVGLVLVLYLGYHRFVEATEKKKPAKKK